MTTTISPAMGYYGAPDWASARWIGEIADDAPFLSGDQKVDLAHSEGYERARLLVRSQGRPRGVIELSIRNGQVSGVEASEAVRLLPQAAPSGPDPTEFITVAVSTRNRPENLRELIPTLLALDYPDFEILIVDNASSDNRTAEVVASFDEPRLRFVREDRVGLSCARNRALVEAGAPIVAFTDDDVVVDRLWLKGLASGFERRPDVALVTGMVCTGELRTAPQGYFEERTGWQQRCTDELFSLGDGRPDIRSFPLDVSRYGTGASFAVRREHAIALGGFNEALGIGSPTKGGEDLDMFVRTLFAGQALAYEPNAIVWHRHRAEVDDLERSMADYALSFSAWMASLLENRQIRGSALRIGARHVLRRLRSKIIRAQTATAAGPRTDGLSSLDYVRSIERRALLHGPRVYIRTRRSGHSSRPLAGSSS